MTTLDKLIETLVAKSSILITPIIVNDYLAYETTPNFLLPLLKALKESEELRFTILTDLFGIDFPERDKRFEVVYNLLSLKLNKRFIIKAPISEKENIPSAIGIFNAACWYEREVYDMYGVNFDGNDDKRRILTDYEFEGYPLRKDFPLTGYTQVKYDNELKKVVYEPVNLDVEYREFDFSSHWHSPRYVLPGDEKAKWLIILELLLLKSNSKYILQCQLSNLTLFEGPTFKIDKEFFKTFNEERVSYIHLRTTSDILKHMAIDPKNQSFIRYDEVLGSSHKWEINYDEASFSYKLVSVDKQNQVLCSAFAYFMPFLFDCIINDNLEVVYLALLLYKKYSYYAQ